MKMKHNNILVAVDGIDPNDYTMERAIEQAQLDAASLVVAHVVPTATYESRRRGIARTPALRNDRFSYTIDQAEAGAETVAERAARTAIGDLDVEYVAVGAVGRIDRILPRIADEHGCGTIVLAEERSWWRRRMGWGGRKFPRDFVGRVVRVPRRRTSLISPDPAVLDARFDRS